MNDLQSKVQVLEETCIDKNTVARLESKIRDLENRLELEETTRHRFEVSNTKMITVK